MRRGVAGAERFQSLSERAKVFGTALPDGLVAEPTLHEPRDRFCGQPGLAKGVARHAPVLCVRQRLPCNTHDGRARVQLAGIREAKLEDWMTTPAGQSVEGIHAIKPAAEVVYDLVEEAQEQFDHVLGQPVA